EVADLAAAGDGAGGGNALAREDLGEGGLARAVTADEADAVALGDLEGGGLDEDAGTGAQFDTGGGDHGQTPGRVEGGVDVTYQTVPRVAGRGGARSKRGNRERRGGESHLLMRKECGHAHHSNGPSQPVFPYRTGDFSVPVR